MPITIGPGITAGHGVFIGGGYANASGGNVTTYGSGNTITRVHTFTVNGNFTTSERPLDVQILLVGGGGGGGNSDYWDGGYYVGGAGGGGAVYNSSGSSGIIANANTTYTVTVGTGGASDTNGGNSSVFGYTVLGGGKGGTNVGNAQVAGGNGGCGGGAYQSADAPGPSGTIGYTIQTSTFGYGLGRNGELGGAQVGVDPLYYGGTGGGAGGDDGQEYDTFFSDPGNPALDYAAGGYGGLIKENGSGNSPGTTQVYLGSGGGSNGFSTGQSGRDGVVVIKYTVTTN